MPSRPSAVVLHAASADRPDEVDTVRQAEAVAAALNRLGWNAETRVLGASVRALNRLLRPRPAFVFNLIEAVGGDGRGAHLAARELNRLGMIYTGSGERAQLLTTVKPLAKRVMRSAGLPTPDWIEDKTEAALPVEPQHFIVKPTCEDASFGIDARSVVPLLQVRHEIAARAAGFGGEWFAEAFVDGREFNVGLLDAGAGPEVLPIAEILFVDYPEDRPRIVDYEAKWLEDSFAYGHTPRRFPLPPQDADLLQELRILATRVYRLFGLCGYGRVDFRVDRAGRPWILEVNANPCLAEDAGFMASAQEAGLTVDDVVARIVSATDAERVCSVA